MFLKRSLAAVWRSMDYGGKTGSLEASWKSMEILDTCVGLE